MDYLIPVCLVLLGLLAMFAPNWLMPVFIVVAGWLGILACGWLWLLLFFPLLNGVGLAYALWLMFKRPSFMSRLVAVFCVISVILMLALYYAFLTMPPFPAQH
ncbi:MULTISPECIES: hypothetical protein [Escherichia]|uniref:Uncharacterized protein n=1 Tax=Escherichia whittamii TaxID=2762229 RepID=A0ABR8TG92_9ESCH|nr:MULTISPECIES: hypothetical protein [Escherichia]QLX46643.1 hypothetical protein HV146_22435 [Escherichia coli]MBD7974324.1 hypothetical protein [Escherichia whittamii]MCA4893240.1 hypothetical protein [Escherichia whittamii]MEC9497722.1 hypothetical protein [Escherichia whittamii]MEC9562010.1 hypothetical protein [Escherichia whittamii]